MNYADWEALRDHVALRIWQLECVSLRMTNEEAAQRWAELPPHAGSGRRVQLKHVAGCALIALEEMGRLSESPRVNPRMAYIEREREG